LRCSRVVEKKTVSVARKVVMVALFALTLPYAWLLFVAGPGVVGVLPIVIAMGFGITSGLEGWVNPIPLCSHCGASLEHAPVVERSARAAVIGARRTQAER
jgi:hypothetical protein